MGAPNMEGRVFTAIVLDFETGGLDCTKSACTQLAMQAVRLDTWEILERYAQYFKPYYKQETGLPKRKVLKSKHDALKSENEPMEYEEAALTYSNITMGLLEAQGMPLKSIANDVIEFARRNTLSKGAQGKPILIGQNIQFDIGFLQQLMCFGGVQKEFEKTFAGHLDFYGNFQPHYVDTIDLGHWCFGNDLTVSSYKLEIIAEKLGIELIDAHDADADVSATLNIAAVCANRLRNESTVSFPQKECKTRAHFKI